MSTQKSFEQFVLDNKDYIRKKCTVTRHRFIKESLTSGLTSEKEICICPKLFTKWSQTLDSFFDLKLSNSFKENLSLYLEMIYMYKDSIDAFNLVNNIYPDTTEEIDLLKILTDIKNKIIAEKRLKIIDKYYNYFTGKVEYLLEDGTYIPIDEEVKNKIIEDSSILPIDVLSIIDPAEYRNQKIQKIL